MTTEGSRHLIVEAFSRSSLLQALDSADRTELARRSAIRTYRRGEVVFSEGDTADALMVLVSGRLKVSTFSAAGKELIMTHVLAGETLGELGVLSGGARSATVSAVERSSVAMVAGSLVIEILAKRPAVALAMLRQLADTVRRLTDVASDLVFLSLEQRVAKFVLDRFGDAPNGELSMTQVELASYVGASRQRVNACLQALAQHGWITLRRGRVTVVDVEALQRFASP